MKCITKIDLILEINIGYFLPRYTHGMQIYTGETAEQY